MNIEWDTSWRSAASIADLTGETLVSVTGAEVDSSKDEDEVVFVTESGKAIKLYHEQDCCENVRIVDVEMDADDYAGALVISAEEVVGETMDDDCGTHTYTFYKVETTKGGIWIRWLGESNGYYSEAVDVISGKVIPRQESKA